MYYFWVLQNDFAKREQKHALVINIIDAFTRKWLYRSEGFIVTNQSLKSAREHIIANQLQPNDCLRKDVNIEIRNDNDPRFTTKMIQDFIRETQIKSGIHTSICVTRERACRKLSCHFK